MKVRTGSARSEDTERFHTTMTVCSSLLLILGEISQQLLPEQHLYTYYVYKGTLTPTFMLSTLKTCRLKSEVPTFPFTAE